MPGLAWLATATLLFAAPPQQSLNLTGDGRWVVDMVPHSAFLEDPTHRLSIEELATPDLASQFKQLSNKNKMRRISQSSFWIRVQVNAEVPRVKDAILFVPHSYYDYVDIFLTDSHGQVQHFELGDRLPFSRRPIQTEIFAVPLQLDEIRDNAIYVRIRTPGVIVLETFIASAEGFMQTHYLSRIINAALNGAVFILFVFHVFLYISVREKSYIYFCIHLVGITLTSCWLTGWGFHYLWPNSPILNTYSPAATFISRLTHIPFVMAVLTSRQLMPKLHRVGVYCFWICLATFLAQLALPHKYAIKFWLLGTGISLWIAPAIVLGAFRRHRPAYYLLAAFTSSMFIEFIQILALLMPEVFPFSTTEGMGIVSAIDIAALCFMAFAVAENINRLKHDKDLAQQISLRLEQAHASELEIEVEKKTFELTKANHKLQEADERKTRFFQNISHELRTPLTLIMNPLDALARENPDEQRVYLAARNARRMYRLVNQLLDFQKIQAGATQLQLAPLNLTKILEICAEHFERPCEDKEISLRITLNAGETADQVNIRGEIDALEKIVFNLLSNALKHTPPKEEITLVLQTTQTDARILVSDTGRGISPEGQARLFQVFSQVDESTTREYEGTGLGLALVKELAQAMNGSVGIHSEVGRGSTFWVEFPRNTDGNDDDAIQTFEVKQWLTADTPGRSVEEESTAQYMRTVSQSDAPLILVVDDLPDMRTLIGNCLQEHGFRIITASNGERGLEVAKRYSPDLIITDWMMPELSGPDLILQLKESPWHASIPIILLTAKSDDESKILGRQVGADAFLGKPFNEQELNSVVRNLLNLKAREKEVEQLNQQLIENVLKRYLPPDLIDQILDGEMEFAQEPKGSHITVLFSDIVGFTHLTEQLQAHKTGQILNEYLTAMNEVIFEHGGTIDKFIGDAIMVMFGAPRALPVQDQTRAAVSCANAMQKKLNNLNRAWSGRDLPDLQMRIGIHHGPVVVGAFGSDRRSDYTAIGPAVNLASRIETACAPGDILVSENVQQHLAVDEVEDYGEHTLKGVSGNQRLYRII